MGESIPEQRDLDFSSGHVTESRLLWVLMESAAGGPAGSGLWKASRLLASGSSIRSGSVLDPPGAGPVWGLGDDPGRTRHVLPTARVAGTFQTHKPLTVWVNGPGGPPSCRFWRSLCSTTPVVSCRLLIRANKKQNLLELLGFPPKRSVKCKKSTGLLQQNEPNIKLLSSNRKWSIR